VLEVKVLATAAGVRICNTASAVAPWLSNTLLTHILGAAVQLAGPCTKEASTDGG